MRGKPKKTGPKGGAKRHISNIKRSNQKRNKLVKQGKAKPLNSTPRYIPNQAKKAKLENTITPWQPSEEELKGNPCRAIKSSRLLYTPFLFRDIIYVVRIPPPPLPLALFRIRIISLDPGPNQKLGWSRNPDPY